MDRKGGLPLAFFKLDQRICDGLLSNEPLFQIDMISRDLSSEAPSVFDESPLTNQQLDLNHGNHGQCVLLVAIAVAPQ